MIKAIIIDDEYGARLTLMGMLKLFCPSIHVLGEAKSSFEGRELIRKVNPNIVFLDIKMPFESGFDLLESLEEQNFHVIFTTAYNNYALKAIRFSALDYLLKPIKVKDLQRSVEKASTNLVNKEQYNVFKAHQINEHDQQIVLPLKDGFKVIDCIEIVQVEGSRNYSWVHFINGEKVLVARTLKEFEDIFSKDIFFRVHQSNIINIKCVRGYKKGRGGIVELINGNEVALARSRKQEFLTIFDKL